ncbi:pleckstrin homology domain-containing family J member 1-like [Microplitis mediator]|uniref:pleckstrin homology domain-containing family J member 1 n=1 Tax=Microplitis demolitor TaxID=69319 RepID=UPI0004CD1100|nr:pleckstrin homology domain-containing family J member 1 [Microplitis demolitor]XP_057338360.1 pleckstrin homology domain-containing family J member 1-like [Microplitis mediator]
MKYNEKELIEISRGIGELEGRLNHKRAHKSVFKERWFKLKSNLLFYFNITELGQVDEKQPAGIIILENYNVNTDAASEGPFAFSIVFRDEQDKRHILTGRSESQVSQWVSALKQASYEYWRSQLIMLQEKLCQKTGKDPLLIFPRNRGVIRDEAWNTTTTFRSHIRSLTGSTSSLTSVINKETNLIELS